MTVGKVVNRLGILPKPSLIICDESQHSKAKTYMKIFKFYNDVPRLGFSGSPWRMSGEGFDDVYDDLVEGPSVSWLISHHKLAPYEYYSVKTFDTERLKKSSTGDYTNTSITKSMKPTLYGDIVKTWISKAKGKRTIVYAHDIEHSKLIAQAFRNSGIKAMHADSKTPKEERKKIMNDFRSGAITVLCNVSLVDEGFSVNECECCVIARPTQSMVFNIQASMRCMRYVPGKIGIIIDHAGNYQRFGLPDTERHWSLTGSGKKSHDSSNDDAPAIRTCSNCYAVIPGESKICPLCGFEQPVQSVEVKNDKDKKLQKIEEFKLVAEEPCTMEPNEAKSYSDLAKIAHSRGYKRGWVFYQAKLRGFIKGAK